MAPSEFQRLTRYEFAKKRAFRPSIHVTSRRSAKNNSVGKIFKESRHPQVWIEKVFSKPNWTKLWKTNWSMHQKNWERRERTCSSHKKTLPGREKTGAKTRIAFSWDRWNGIQRGQTFPRREKTCIKHKRTIVKRQRTGTMCGKSDKTPTNK